MIINTFITTEPPIYRTHNAVLEQVITLLKTILSNRGIEWAVMQGNQPTIQELQTNTVYIDVISKRRYGIQGRKSIQDGNNKWWKGDVWYEDWLIQISAFQKRPVIEDVAVQDYTGEDIISLLQASLNGAFTDGMDISFYDNTPIPDWAGAQKPRRWAQFIRSTDIRVIDYETDSGLKEKLPQFDFTLIVEQGLKDVEPEISEYDMESHPV